MVLEAFTIADVAPYIGDGAIYWTCRLGGEITRNS